MIDYIFNLFFSKTKNAQPLTIIKNRELSNKFRQISIKKQVEASTCLAEYFKDRNGLNTKERLNAY